MESPGDIAIEPEGVAVNETWGDVLDQIPENGLEPLPLPLPGRNPDAPPEPSGV
jgi:hypothetical protein